MICFNTIQEKDDGLYHTSDCKPSNGLIVSSVVDNGVRFVDNDSAAGKFGGAVRTKVVTSEYTRGYRVCFTVKPYDFHPVSRCLPDPGPEDVGEVQLIPYGTDIPNNAKYIVAQGILKRPFATLAFNISFEAHFVKLSPDASFAVISSRAGLYKIYRGGGEMHLLAGSLVHDTFEYKNGRGRESRFNMITSAAVSTTSNFIYVSDYFNGGSIRKVDLSSGKVTHVYTGPNINTPGIVSLDISMDEYLNGNGNL